jgi:hypothetical protein
LILSIKSALARPGFPRRHGPGNITRRALLSRATSIAGVATIASVSEAVAAVDYKDADAQNLALNLLYLQAQYYSLALGSTVPPTLLTGTGKAGIVLGGGSVPFNDPLLRSCTEELASDKIAHIVLLRQLLGENAIAQPSIDLSAASSGGFSTIMRAAGLIDAASAFDPYTSEENFLMGAFIFEDVAVTAWRGVIALIKNSTAREIAAGMLATTAHHAALIRCFVSERATASPGLVAAIKAISDARDRFDGATEIDQGIDPTSRTTTGTSSSLVVANVAPTDDLGLVYSRAPGQTLGVMYVAPPPADKGGFFPAGVNGTSKMSAPA